MKTKLLTLLLCLLSSLPALAIPDFQVGGIYYNITGDNTVKVTEPDNNGGYSGSITIPAEVQYAGNTYSVTSIGDWAFQYCTGLTSITLPNSITSIGDAVFYDCSGLTSITLPNSIKSIGTHTFANCTALTSITLPDSITSIGIRTFQDCAALTSIALPNSIKSIDNYAFKGCSGLTSITLPNSLTYIGICTFFCCSGLTSITLPNSLTDIDNCAFQYCTRLTEIYCEAEVPPTCSIVTFDNVDFANCTLYVPTVAVEAYRKAYPWSEFHIVGYDFAGVAEVSSVSPAVACDLQGRRVSNPRRGIFIVNGQKQRLN